MNSVNYLEAWSMWASGISIRDAKLFGLPVFWWGRIGKLLSLLGGAAAILDIIGPRRVQEWGRTRYAMALRVEKVLRITIAFSAIAILNLVFILLNRQEPLLVVPLVVFSLFLLAGIFAYSVRDPASERISRMVESDRFPRVVMVAGYGTFLIGFHFDLLAS